MSPADEPAPGKAVEFEFTPDRRYARRLFAHTSRAARLASAGITVVLIAAGFGAITADSWAILAGLLSLAVGAALAVRLVAGTWLNVQRVPQAWFAHRQYSIDAEELAVHTARFTAAYRWDAVARVVHIRDAYVIHFASMHGFLDLPTATMTDEQRTALHALLAKHGLLDGTARGQDA
jgi:hypothetical protein